MPYPSQISEKGGQTDNRFLKYRCCDNREIDHTAASRGGSDSPRPNGDQRFPRNTLTVQALNLQAVAVSRFPPAPAGKNGHGNGSDGSATI